MWHVGICSHTNSSSRYRNSRNGMLEDLSIVVPIVGVPCVGILHFGPQILFFVLGLIFET